LKNGFIIYTSASSGVMENYFTTMRMDNFLNLIAVTLKIYTA
jgi:hypothetical protein